MSELPSLSFDRIIKALQRAGFVVVDNVGVTFVFRKESVKVY